MKIQAMEVSFTTALEIERLLYNRLKVLADRQCSFPTRTGKRYNDLSRLMMELRPVWVVFRDHALSIRQGAGLQ